MEDFFEFKTENMGGMADEFQFAPIDSIIAIATANECVVSSPVVFLSGNNFFTGLAMRDTLEFDEKQTSGGSGDIFSTGISGMVPQMTAEYLALFSQMVKKRFIIVVTDNNGNKRICGNKLAGMKFQFDQNSSTTPAGIAGYKFSFTLLYHQASAFYHIGT